MENGKLVLEDRLYTINHEWVKKVGNNRYRIGITDYAQYKLKDIVAVELPNIGQYVEQVSEEASNKSKDIGQVQSNKSVSPIFSPISGKVVAINDANNMGEVYPENIEVHAKETYYGGELYNINKKPYDTWLIEVETDDEKQLEKLLDAEAYRKELASLPD